MRAPLSSLKILDFSTLLPGPFATKTLADLGAEVLRVENFLRPDITRSISLNENGGLNAHASLNRSKHSIGLNLKHPEAIKIVNRLIKKYDIVVEQFRPGVMKRLGLDYQQLRIQNPSLIYCSLTGYGQTGGYSNRAGHDLNYLAISGVSNYSRRKNELPVPLGVQVADIAGGSYHVVIGILSAFIHRQLTGEGQAIDISMADAVFSMNVFECENWIRDGKGTEPESSFLNGGTLYDYYYTKDGRIVSVSSLEPHFFAALIKAMDLPETLLEIPLSDQKSQKRLKKILKKRFLELPWSYWEAEFAKCDACVELVLEFTEAMEHHQFKEREMFVDVPDASGKTQRQIASPIKFSSCKAEYRHVGVELGEQTEMVLKDLGYSIAQINKLTEDGVCEVHKAS
tara:strand:- start:14 stop:1210 length:1197 start_codon:yes stop_codon:yes gene_type:complete